MPPPRPIPAAHRPPAPGFLPFPSDRSRPPTPGPNRVILPHLH